MPKKIITSEIIITDIEFPNVGIGNIEDKKITVKNALPQQKLLVNLKKKRKKLEGRIVNILEKAPYEIESDCKKFNDCGGCTFQNITYEKELEIKKNNVLKLLDKANIKDYNFLGIVGSPNTKGYRNKMEFSFGDTGLNAEMSLGMRKRESFYEVVTADKCNIVDSDFNKIVKCVLDFFENSCETFYHKTKRTGTLRHLVVRKGFFTEEILINLITTDNLNTNLDYLKESLISLNLNGKIVSILHTINNSVADVVKSEKTNILYGNDYFFENLLELQFKISAFSFFQTNSAGAEALYSIVKEFAGNISNKIIFDLYCGTGTIAQIIAQNAKKVIGIEIVEEAIISARENTKINNINNCEFIVGDVLETVENISEKPDLIILDPPREGIHPKAIDKIINFNSPELIYISCKPSSMVRDLEIFIENGYKIEQIKCIDMFPRTYHVETILKLSYKNSK